jgi:hypothetical protein
MAKDKKDNNDDLIKLAGEVIIAASAVAIPLLVNFFVRKHTDGKGK